MGGIFHFYSNFDRTFFKQTVETVIRCHTYAVSDLGHYYIPINDTMFEMSVFWPSDTESLINELRFSESVSLSFKTRLMLVTCFCGDAALRNFQAWNQRQKT